MNESKYDEIKERKFEAWRHGLLDISKRNKLMNYRKTQRATLRLTSPGMLELYLRLVINGESISLRKQIDAGDDLHLSQLFYIMEKMDAPVELAEGEILSDLSVSEMNRTLKNLRAKAKLSLEEQGINILYLSFGFLQWRQKPNDDYIISPLVLVPVSLELQSILKNYYIKRLEEDIVINPTLEYALFSEYGIKLPEFGAQTTDELDEYLDRITDMVSRNGWNVIKEVNLGLLSFLKIVMYNDLDKNKNRIFENHVIQAFCGAVSALPPIDDSLKQYPHDSIPAKDICQVVNADASQQDAILLSRKGVSFVLQGPPGTGKSQTITNIISQALADRKKVLFVSEKMAALSVVYRRLEEVGLSDYCLSLHNYKAERGAVIQDLVNALDAPTRSIKAGITDALSELEEERGQLNSYIEELNKLREPLNSTIFDVLTEVVTTETPYKFNINEDVHCLSDAELKSRTNALKKIAEFFSENGYEIWNSPWRGTSITALTYDIRNIINQQLGQLEDYLSDRITSTTDINHETNRNTIWTLRGFKDTLEAWVELRLVESLSKEGANNDKGFHLCGVGYERLLELSGRLDGCIKKALDAGLDSIVMDNLDSIHAELSRMCKIKANVQRCEGLLGTLNRVQPIKVSNDLDGLRRGRALIKAITVPYPVMGRWFEAGQYASIIHKCQNWMSISDKVKSIRNRIDAVWEKGIYSLEYEKLINRFSNDYTSFFKRLFSSRYNEDKSRFSLLRKDHLKKVPDSECLSVLETLKSYHDLLQEFSSETTDAPSLLGGLYQGVESNWHDILRILNECSPVNDYIQNYGYSDALIMYLGKKRDDRLNNCSEATEGDCFQKILAGIENVSLDGLNSESFSVQKESLDVKEACLNELVSAYEEACENLESYKIHCNGETINSVSCIYNNLKQMAVCFDAFKTKNKQFIEQSGFMEEHIPVQNEHFLKYYDESALQSRADLLKSLVEECKPDEFESCLHRASENILLKFEQGSILSEFESWFCGEDFDSIPLQELADRVCKCRNPEPLQLWLRYHALEKDCADHGLSEYLEFVERNAVPAEEIVRAYRKAILFKWLIVETETIQILQNFHSYAHEKIISDFRNSDCRQLQIAKARLVDLLSHEKPSGNNLLFCAMDEVSILRREAEKKRKTTSLRKLFKTLPTLIQKLKPCFMMSPLSVSYFLDSEMYNFDLVIFDEASQILPEDAVGAIYRGKQVIIAGDSKQMPPTSFFSSASNNTDDYDVDENCDEYLPDVVSESILDEANACLPLCTLLWHYRSKDESLISFSNKQLYGNKLITFPAPSRAEDRGLEYVYVPDGCYEGGGKNCNIMEAEKCLELVIEHIHKHRDRSLGIIAFSEKQQSVIEEVINDYRLKHPENEEFFKESNKEPFFVKNLENVQGDERDTIIFSICYAKNAEGRMYQRFGPLAYSGGERRLNVAITRAKYNVKLVGSIVPTDIVVNEGTKDGVRLLQEYIHYAMQNSFSIEAGTDNENDEPFVDYVASCLRKEGYECITNVGSSKYKVDIAVRQPGNSNEFIAGIECDGSSYSFVRTARDRDLLRRSIMTSFGWNMYHVWSLAWFLNPGDEKRRLIEFLSQCCEKQSAPKDTPFMNEQPEFSTTEDVEITDIQSMTEESDDHNRTLDFEEYEMSRPWEISNMNLDTLIMWVVEHEHPIYFEDLCRRLAYVYGRDRVTNSVRQEIGNCILELESKIIRLGDFVYLRNAEIKARKPKLGDEPRSIDHISPEEIQDAMRRILIFAPGLTENDLISETVRNLGYKRNGNKIIAIMDDNYNTMRTAGKIRECDGKLYYIWEGK